MQTKRFGIKVAQKNGMATVKKVRKEAAKSKTPTSFLLRRQMSTSLMMKIKHLMETIA